MEPAFRHLENAARRESLPRLFREQILEIVQRRFAGSDIGGRADGVEGYSEAGVGVRANLVVDVRQDGQPESRFQMAQHVARIGKRRLIAIRASVGRAAAPAH